MPNASEEVLVKKHRAIPAEENRPPFAKGLCFYKLVWIFAIGCLMGYLIETIVIFITRGVYENCQGMVWGPFNQIYGFGAVVMSLLLTPLASRGNLCIFTVGSLVGGGFEFLCSWVQENVFGTLSWDYSHYPTNIGGRTNLLYMAFWGVLALAYVRFIHPLFSSWIERLRPKRGALLSRCLAVFFSLNLLVSGLAVTRWNDRINHIPAQHPVAVYLDKAYPDARMEQVYPEMVRTAAPQEELPHDTAS